MGQRLMSKSAGVWKTITVLMGQNVAPFICKVSRVGGEYLSG